MAGTGEAESIDLGVVDRAHRHRDRLLADETVEPLPLVGGEQLRIVEAGYAHPDRQHRRATYDRPGKRPHAHLVDARHDLIAHREGHALVAPQHRSHRERRVRGATPRLKPPLTGGRYSSVSSPFSSGSASAVETATALRRSRMRAPFPTFARR